MIDNLAVFISCFGIIWVAVSLLRASRKSDTEKKHRVEDNY